MKASGYLVASSSKLSACMKYGKIQLLLPEVLPYGLFQPEFHRPLSATVIELSLLILTKIVSQNPANASSTALSTISYTEMMKSAG